MHPVSYLFEDVYRNDWGIVSAALSEKRRGRLSPGAASRASSWSASAADPQPFFAS